MLVQVGKGIESNVDLSKLGLDESKLSPVAASIVYLGLRNRLMDSHAGCTKESGDDYLERSRETVQRTLNALYNGEVRAHSTRAGDPVAVQMRALAQKDAKKAIIASGRKMRDVKSELVTAVVNKLLEKNDAAYRKVAERMVKAAQSVEVDMSDIQV